MHHFQVVGLVTPAFGGLFLKASRKFNWFESLGDVRRDMEGQF
jgi:hypothetical protein